MRDGVNKLVFRTKQTNPLTKWVVDDEKKVICENIK